MEKKDEISVDENEKVLEKIRERSEEYDLREEVRAEGVASIKKDALQLKRDLRDSEFSSLSAPQIGVMKRLVALKHKNDIRVYANPVIVSSGGAYAVSQVEEICPEEHYVCFRPSEMTLAYTNEKGEAMEVELIGWACAEMDKQLQRLDGLLVSDFGKFDVDNKFKTLKGDDLKKFLAELLAEIAEQTEAVDELKKSDKSFGTMMKKFDKAKEKLKDELVQEIKEKSEAKKEIKQKINNWGDKSNRKKMIAENEAQGWQSRTK